MAVSGLRSAGHSSTSTPPAKAQAGQQVPQQHEQHVQPAQQGQQIIYLNWSHFKPEFQENLMRMQKLICSVLMTG